MNQLIKQVNEWANSRHIYENTTANTQLALAYVELGEFVDSVLMNETITHSALELGDIIVCLINYVTMGPAPWLLNINRILEFDDPYDVPPSENIEKVFLYAFTILEDTEYFIEHIIPFLAGLIRKTPRECLQLTYEKIKIRKGDIKNEKFIKL
jgi:hypothetical protein